MKQKCLLIASVLLMLFAFWGQVQAITIDLDYGDDRYIGYIHQYSSDDASETSLAGYLNYLITIDKDDGTDDGVDAGVFEYGSDFTTTVDPDTYSGSTTPLFDRFDSDLDTSFAAADDTDSARIDSSVNTFLFNQTISWDYVVGKYDGPNAGWLAWDISDVTFNAGDMLVLPSAWTPDPDPPQYGLSNYTFYNGGNGGGGGGDPIPEPATFMLFGIGLLGLARVSRRKK